MHADNKRVQPTGLGNPDEAALDHAVVELVSKTRTYAIAPKCVVSTIALGMTPSNASSGENLLSLVFTRVQLYSWFAMTSAYPHQEEGSDAAFTMVWALCISMRFKRSATPLLSDE